MSAAPVSATFEDSFEDPVQKALRRDDKVQLVQGEDLTMAEIELEGDRYFFTFHSIVRFMARADQVTRDLFPHLDLDYSDHALFAMILLFRQGAFGTYKNVKRQGEGRFSSGWLFVLVEEGGVNKVVTSYPKNSTTRFYHS